MIKNTNPYIMILGLEKNHIPCYGGIIFDGKYKTEIKGHTKHTKWKCKGPFAGTIMGIMDALDILKKQNIDRLDIYYEYEGIKTFTEDENKIHDDIYKKYYDLVNQCRDNYNMDIKFKKSGPVSIRTNRHLKKLALSTFTWQ